MLPKSIYRFVWTYGKAEQLRIILVTLLSFPLAYLALELPKLIIDDAITGTLFPQTVLGFRFSQVEYLALLCLAFFIVFCASNLVKYHLNIMRGLSGARLLRRMRYSLIDHVMRLKKGREGRYTPGEMVQIVIAELHPIGGFVGDSFAVPMLQIGMLLVYVGFIFMQDATLGVLSILLIPVQAYIVPKMQQRVVRLNQQRIVNMREASDQIAETVAWLPNLRHQDAMDWRRATISATLYENFKLRYAIFRQKFLIKFVNNVLNQIMPFAFYLVGGYLVIQNQLQIGALVVAIAAYRDLSTPWRELLRHYQTHSDVTSRYAAIFERFDGAEIEHDDSLGGAIEPKSAAAAERAARDAASAGEVTVGPLRRDAGAVLGQGVTIPRGATIALTAKDPVLRADAAAAIAGLGSDLSGAVALGGAPLLGMPARARAELVGYVGAEPMIVAGALRDNMSLSLLRPRPATASDSASIEVREAALTGNFLFEAGAPMLDLDAAEVSDIAELDARLLELAEAVGLERQIFQLGLDAPIDPERDPALAKALLRMRASLRGARNGIARDVEFWRPDRLNTNATLLENLLFAAPISSAARSLDMRVLRDLRRRLMRSEVAALLVDLGAEIVEATADLIELQRPGSPLLQNFDLFPPEDALALRGAARRWRRALSGIRLAGEAASAAARKIGVAAQIAPSDETVERLALSAHPRMAVRLMTVALRFTPARHRLDVLTEARQAALLAARLRLSVWAYRTARNDSHFAPLDEAACVPQLSIRENAMLGKLRANRRDQSGRLDQRLWDLAQRADAAPAIAGAGLDRRIEERARPFSIDERRRIAAVRALLGRPALLVLDGLGGGQTEDDIALIEAIKRVKGDATLILTREAGSNVDGVDGRLDLDLGALIMGRPPEAKPRPKARKSRAAPK